MGMSKHHKRDEWLQDIEARQRNVVFPDTVQNEARFWRNLGNRGWSASTKAGLYCLRGLCFRNVSHDPDRDFPSGCDMEPCAGNVALLGSLLRRYRLGHSSQSPKYAERSTPS